MHMAKPKENKPYIIIDFTKVWRFVIVKRPGRELIKCFLFGVFPVLFRRLADYQHCKTSCIYLEKGKTFNVHICLKCNLFTCYITKYTLQENSEKLALQNIDKIAIIIHVYYLDVFSEILNRLETSDFQNFKLFDTVPSELWDSMLEALKSTSFQFSFHEVENRGEDVLPFLALLPKVFDEVFELILKIHIKQSNHLKRNEDWRDDLFNKLIDKNAINNAIRVFESREEIGIIGLTGHILLMSYYYGANAGRVDLLSNELGLDREQLVGFNFVAGTMFFARQLDLILLLKWG